MADSAATTLRPRPRFWTGLSLAVTCAALAVASGCGPDQDTLAVPPRQTTPTANESAIPPPEGNSLGEAPEQPSESAAPSDGEEGDADETAEPEPSASGTSDGKENQAPTLAMAIGLQEVVIGEAVGLVLERHFEDADGDPLRWVASSSNDAVATVAVSDDTIEITGVGEGTATVTVTVRDLQGQFVEEAFEVSVENAVISLEVVGVETLNAVGETAELRVTAGFADGAHEVVDGSLVAWRSSDFRVVTVAAGTVTAVAGGIATLTATYEDQSAQLPVSVAIAVQEPKTVRVVYAVPSDREFRSDYSEAIERAILGVQSWYRRQLNGLTFSLYDTVPQECQMGQPSEFYHRYSWERVVDGVQHCAPVKGGLDNDFTWVVYADVMPGCGPWEHGFERLGRGAIGLTILGRRDLFGLVDEDADYQRCGEGYAHRPGLPYGRWEGGLAHELGHTLHLVHPPGCDEGRPGCDHRALIAGGWFDYPDTYLRFDDKEALLRSRFIDGPRPSAGEGPTGRGAVVRGTVTDPGGAPVEGLRLSLSVEPFWNWTQTDVDGTFEIPLPAGAAGAAVVSVHAGQAADCRWLGYYAPRGLTTVRTAATEVPVHADETTEVTLELPAQPDELCARPRVLSVTVREADGTPARRLTVGASGGHVTVEPDGGAEIPLNDPWAAPILSIYDEALDCGLVGYYGADGEFTTRREDAARFEFGAAAAELELPANRRDLCDAQELIIGTVQWPDGTPAAGIWLYAEAVGIWAYVGADGTFTIRQPPGSPRTAVGVYAGHVADCGSVGYLQLGLDGLVTRRDEAASVSAGVGITITLPAAPDQLCGP